MTAKRDDMDEQDLDDIKSLKANLKKNKLTEEELESLRVFSKMKLGHFVGLCQTKTGHFI